MPAANLCFMYFYRKAYFETLSRFSSRTEYIVLLPIMDKVLGRVIKGRIMWRSARLLCCAWILDNVLIPTAQAMVIMLVSLNYWQPFDIISNKTVMDTMADRGLDHFYHNWNKYIMKYIIRLPTSPGHWVDPVEGSPLPLRVWWSSVYPKSRRSPYCVYL